jgi:transposase
VEHIGVGLGRAESQISILTDAGELLSERIRTERGRFVRVLGARPNARILIEASTESEWVARCLEELGHEVIVADPNYAPMYAQRSWRVKTDRRDAEALAHLRHHHRLDLWRCHFVRARRPLGPDHEHRRRRGVRGPGHLVRLDLGLSASRWRHARPAQARGLRDRAIGYRQLGGRLNCAELLRRAMNAQDAEAELCCNVALKVPPVSPTYRPNWAKAASRPWRSPAMELRPGVCHEALSWKVSVSVFMSAELKAA